MTQLDRLAMLSRLFRTASSIFSQQLELPEPFIEMNKFELIRRQINDRLGPLRAGPIELKRIPQAAVTLLLRESVDGAELLIIKRSERDGDPWSGHLALPGGRADAGDRDLLATAARETREEIGVDLIEDASFIGQLPLLAPNNPRLPRIEITPFIAIAPPNLTMQLNHEIASTFWMSIERLSHEGLSGSYSMQFGDVVKSWPAYRSESGPIWGITERILTSFLTLID